MNVSKQIVLETQKMALVGQAVLELLIKTMFSRFDN